MGKFGTGLFLILIPISREFGTLLHKIQEGKIRKRPNLWIWVCRAKYRSINSLKIYFQRLFRFFSFLFLRFFKSRFFWDWDLRLFLKIEWDLPSPVLRFFTGLKAIPALIPKLGSDPDFQSEWSRPVNLVLVLFKTYLRLFVIKWGVNILLYMFYNIYFILKFLKRSWTLSVTLKFPNNFVVRMKSINDSPVTIIGEFEVPSSLLG